MAHTEQTARSRSTTKQQGTAATGADHQSIGQLLAKLPDRSRSSVNPALTPAEATNQTTQPTHTTQTPQPYGGLKQDSRRKPKMT